MNPGCLFTLVVLDLLAALGVVWAISAENLGAAVILGLLALALTAGIGWGVAKRKQESVIGYTVEVDREAIRFNEPFEVTLTLTARRSCPVTSGKFALRCRERAIDRSGTSDTTYTHTAHEEVVPFSIDRDLYEGEACQHAVRLTIPEGLPASFAGHNNFIEWHVHVSVGLKGMLLDIRHEEPLNVVPEVA